MDCVKIPVYIHSTHVDIKANKEGYIGIKNGHIQYVIDKFKIKRYELDRRSNRQVLVGATNYFTYNENEQVYRFPRYALSDLEKCFRYMKQYGIPVVLDKVYVDPIEPRSIDFKMKDWVKDRPGQTEVIQYLSTDKPMLACEAGTGFGKTTVSIKTAILKKVPFLVICDGLMQQWVSNILEKTNIPKEDIVILQEVKSIAKLIDNLKNGIKPAAIIGSIQTVRNYILNRNLPYTNFITWEELLEKLGIGLIIKDEYHLNFSAYILVDLYSNVRNNIYLSATPRRNDYQEARLFNHIYPPEILGNRTISKKHIDIDLCAYRIDMGVDENRFFRNKYGYSQDKYEKFLLDKRNIGKLSEYIKVIENTICSEYFNKYAPKEVRCIVFCYSRSMCKFVMKYLQTKHPNYKIKTKLAEDPNVNTKADVIVSTLGSLGTGHDVSNLVTIINTVSTKAETKLIQVPGRLRPVSGYQCKYIDIYNSTLQGHRNHLYVKRRIYRSISKKFEEISI